MKLKKTIRKVVVITAWAVVVSGMMTLLIAANRKQQDHVCKKVAITVQGSGDKLFIDKSDVSRALQSATRGKLVNTPVAGFDLIKLESVLKNNPWVSNAEMYFDSQDILHVLVTTKDPIARIFTGSGHSFYLDSAGKKLPLLDKGSVRLPVFTSFPDVPLAKERDSALVSSIRHLAQFINNDPFWSAQIAQVDIVDARYFEALPTIGNHTIKIGTAEDLEAKFARLFTFYKQVLSKTGFDKYGIVDVRFDGQVIASQKGATSSVDSILLQHNIEELLRNSALQATEETAPMETAPQAAITATPPVINYDTAVEKPAPATPVTEPKIKREVKSIYTPKRLIRLNPSKSTKVFAKPVSNPVKKKTPKSKPVKTKNPVKLPPQKPKAVMQRTNEY